LDFANSALINSDGKLNYSTTATTKSGSTNVKSSTTESNSSLDKDAFLQLLVAQMKYQDPMEPTDNTEYISQLTSFSELEQMQNMTNALELQRASGMVGQYVMMKETNESTGTTSTTMGQVDYVFYEGGKAFLNVNGEDYSFDQLDTVVDKEYYTATQLASSFADSYSKLPSLTNLTTSYRTVIENLREVYDDMTAYQKSFLSESYGSGLSEYENRLSALIKEEEAKAEALKASEASADDSSKAASGDDKKTE